MCPIKLYFIQTYPEDWPYQYQLYVWEKEYRERMLTPEKVYMNKQTLEAYKKLLKKDTK